MTRRSRREPVPPTVIDNRDEMLDAEREEDFDALVAAARRTMAETMEEGSA